MELSRQGYWSGLPFPSPGDLPDPGIEPGQTLYHLSHEGSPTSVDVKSDPTCRPLPPLKHEILGAREPPSTLQPQDLHTIK